MRSRDPLQLRVRLLRVLETATVARVGKESLAIDVRILAAGLGVEGAVAASKLGEDLFYRFILAEEDVGVEPLLLGVEGSNACATTAAAFTGLR